MGDNKKEIHCNVVILTNILLASEGLITLSDALTIDPNILLFDPEGVGGVVGAEEYRIAPPRGIFDTIKFNRNEEDDDGEDEYEDGSTFIPSF